MYIRNNSSNKIKQIIKENDENQFLKLVN